MLSLYRQLLRLRRAEPTLSIGSLQLGPVSDHVLAYWRQHGNSRLQILLNLTGTERQVPDGASSGDLLLSTLGSPPRDGWLRPDEGVIRRVAES
jgi:oligo-1,6-glucosidase/alpha-glucosidase